ncbi:hypothetical protein AVEN_117789-1 [Araneus ventricosus]|uniref:Uncharacterized protein n=1 Tax=Araneus ventricosus TaxID=182803 RepID=A0A4Y2BAS0_ARAVE|nr:hypothetical protein AVEN_117789-1 [Araneus ventricosus]
MIGCGVMIALTKMQKKGKWWGKIGSIGRVIQCFSSQACVLLCALLCGVSHYRPRTKPLEAYCDSCTLVISVRSFSTHIHIFPALKSALWGRHFRGNEEMQQAVKNFLRSLGTDFYQEGFLKLISR